MPKAITIGVSHELTAADDKFEKPRNCIGYRRDFEFSSPHGRIGADPRYGDAPRDKDFIFGPGRIIIRINNYHFQPFPKKQLHWRSSDRYNHNVWSDVEHRETVRGAGAGPDPTRAAGW